MAVGPVDVVIIGFPGNKFSGQIAPAIVDLVNSGTIRVVDLLFVMKDESGTITTIEAGDLGEGLEGFLSIDVMQAGALNEEDADEVADDLPLNSAALLIAVSLGAACTLGLNLGYVGVLEVRCEKGKGGCALLV